MSPGQCSCTQVCGCNGCCAWWWPWTGWSPSIFSWHGTIWLFSVPQHEKHFGWEAVLDWWWDDICSWGLFEDHDESFCTMGIQALQHRWKKCVDSMGDYIVEKYPQLVKFDPLHHSQPMNLFSAHPRMLHVQRGICCHVVQCNVFHTEIRYRGGMSLPVCRNKMAMWHYTQNMCDNTNIQSYASRILHALRASTPVYSSRQRTHVCKQRQWLVNWTKSERVLNKKAGTKKETHPGVEAYWRKSSGKEEAKWVDSIEDRADSRRWTPGHGQVLCRI